MAIDEQKLDVRNCAILLKNGDLDQAKQQDHHI